MLLMLMIEESASVSVTKKLRAGVKLADDGVKTLLISTDPAHSLGDCLSMKLSGRASHSCRSHSFPCPSSYVGQTVDHPCCSHLIVARAASVLIGDIALARRVSSGSPAMVEGTDGNLFAMEVDTEKALEEFKEKLRGVSRYPNLPSHHSTSLKVFETPSAMSNVQTRAVISGSDIWKLTHQPCCLLNESAA